MLNQKKLKISRLTYINRRKKYAETKQKPIDITAVAEGVTSIKPIFYPKGKRTTIILFSLKRTKISCEGRSAVQGFHQSFAY